MAMKSYHEMLVKSKDLKEERNTFFKSRAYMCAIGRYYKALQHLCLAILENADDANLMVELRISINLNISTCWLKLKQFELAK